MSRSGLVDALTAHYGYPGRLADYRRQFERTTRTIGEDPAIFATALETLAVQTFKDMGRTTQLQLIRDRFIAGHSNFDLRRHLDCVSPETPIRDVVDRCCVWESHADPAVRRMSKPTPDQTYPAYAVGDTDSDNEVTRVAAVIGPESIRGLVPAGNFDRGASGSKAGVIRYGKTVTTAGEGATESATRGCKPSIPTTLEQMLHSFLDGQRQRQRQPPRQRPPPKQRPFRRDWSDVMCFSCGKMSHAARRCPDFNESSVSAARMAEGKDAGGFHYDTSTCDNGPPAGGKRRLI